MAVKSAMRNRVWVRPVWAIAIGTITFIVCLVPLEWVLRSRGYGNPPLYRYDAVAGYVLKPSQDLTRTSGSRVFINSLGMRAQETTEEKPGGIVRIVVFGDSVPYGGSYIDQEDIFCSVAQNELNRSGDRKLEILNAGVNAWGPQNVFRYIQKVSAFHADMVVVYFPWVDLRRGVSNFHIVPFWENAPQLAVSEFFRHGVWTVFGMLSRRWKGGSAFHNLDDLEENLNALVGIKSYCDINGIAVFFFWSPEREVLLGAAPDSYATDRYKLYERIPAPSIVDMTPVFSSEKEVSRLFVDSCHYSREGHMVAGRFLASFVRTHFEGLRR